MIDETKSAEDVAAHEPQESDFNRKPVWRRFLIMFGGVLFNLITAMVIYCSIMFTWGKEIVPMENLPRGLHYNQMAKSIGFQNGDTPIRIDGKKIASFSNAIMMDISEADIVTVLRNGEEIDLEMPAEGLSFLEMQKSPAFFNMPIRPVVGNVAENTPAYQAGIKSGDAILAVGNATTGDITDVTLELSRRKDIINAEDCTNEDRLRALSLSVVRLASGSEVPDTLALTLDENIVMGIEWDLSEIKNIKTEHQSYTLLQSIPAGFSLAWETLRDYVISLKYLFNNEGIQQVGSFLSIGNLFPSAWNWLTFWNLTAFISIILAVMNILPIPGLDGGHIALLLYEGIMRKQPSPKVMEFIERIGLFILFGLMILAFSNDIMRFFF